MSSDEVDSTENLSKTIVDLIADLEGVDPLELSPPLYSVIDPDALEALFPSSVGDESQTSGHVYFEYYGYEIRVQSDGELVIQNG